MIGFGTGVFPMTATGRLKGSLYRPMAIVARLAPARPCFLFDWSSASSS
jgi:hypothetical protein